ncbi:hypothetical protein MBM_05303 [Drepanopeziza brunnea f. sp. 'multigermtubi' MB_m1]|uniref:Uncharacterized protein n=1 Tax=Marssonina brunnea f. sp. multigermtubi (strain MB_m1) TaxID=1072389 RepID=K1XVU6_MARBU|nr:uncharacterized protein MBM_05303 [Drepanopeziza brunnea f. sp. 'multigermtubi' MB_m1]EKD16834.1 hypothetical protein MBM_05303 [Drepanopeziza brunnea f. sp. 'multigermtubi' MB_m1]
MGQAFSGPNAFRFLGFTPKATAVLQATPMLFLILVLVLAAMTGLGLLAFYIHIVTNRPYRKPKPHARTDLSFQASFSKDNRGPPTPTPLAKIHLSVILWTPSPDANYQHVRASELRSPSPPTRKAKLRDSSAPVTLGPTTDEAPVRASGTPQP